MTSSIHREILWSKKVEGPNKCQNIHDSFKVWFEHLSSIKFLTGYCLMSLSCHNVTNTQNII